MRILVATPQVPFIRGGAEILSDELVRELRGRRFEVEAIQLPFKWYPDERLVMDSLAWRQFDFTEADGQRIDLLIATKFPSYLAAHPDKRLWLYHQHRGAYDRFAQEHSGMEFDAAGTELRDAVRAMDSRGLGECTARAAISRNVASRLNHFTGLDAEVLYPPPRGKDRFSTGPYGDYILHVSRLDRMKRIDLLIRAAALLRGPGRVVIAGTGPEAERLQKLAADCGASGRVSFTGFVPDERLYELYSGAAGVFYGPIDEDYGFATVEAMLSGKPVVTFEDAGGVREFVTDGETGLVCRPDPEALAQALSELLADKAAARRMGMTSRLLTEKISWDPIVEFLTGRPRA